jgi:DNA-binding transcriptional LysR family regulator
MDDRLYKFIRLIEAGTYTKAAEELHISQPALTVAIQKLETQYKSELVNRSGKQLELTPAGKIVYQAALDQESISHHLDETLQRLRQKKPSITLGMIDSLADKLCASPAFEQLETAADITLIVNNSRFLREGVEKRTITAAFVIDDELLRSSVQSAPLGIERLQLVCHPDLKSSIRQEATDGIITDFISYDRPSTTYRHIQHFLTKQGIRTKTRLYSTSPNVMLSMVLSGKGCAVLPLHLCEPYIQSGKLSPILESIQRPLAVIQSPQGKLPGALINFIQTSKELLAEQTC